MVSVVAVCGLSFSLICFLKFLLVLIFRGPSDFLLVIFLDRLLIILFGVRARERCSTVSTTGASNASKVLELCLLAPV